MTDLTMTDVGSYCQSRLAEHKGYSACNKCPINEECASGTGGSLTQESLVDWRNRCVVALSSVLGHRTVHARQERKQ